MNSELKNALEILKKNCKGFKNCEDNGGCEFLGYYGCYLTNKTPEEYSEEDVECQK